MQTITAEQRQQADFFRQFIRERAADGRIFSCTFTKRTTGEKRRMVCRLGVKKHLKGGDVAYDPVEKGLLFVFDVQKQGARSIPLDALEELTLCGEHYQKEVV